MPDRIGIFLFPGINGRGLLRVRASRVVTMFRKRGFECHSFRDSSKRFFLCGDDAHPDRAAFLDDLRARMDGLDRSVFIGASAGGFTALDCGSLLGCDHIMCLSPITRFDTAADPYDPRGRDLVPGLWEAEPEDARRNMATLLAERQYTGRVAIFFPSRNPFDMFQTTSISGHPGVAIRPVDSRRHLFLNGDMDRFQHCFTEAASLFDLPERLPVRKKKSRAAAPDPMPVELVVNNDSVGRPARRA